MSINPVSIPPSPHGISLEAFSQATRAGDAVYISVSGQSLQVLGTGSTASGRSVAWVAPDMDTVSMFTEALARTYGSGIASAVSRELGLTPSPGKPLSSRTIERAIDMAQTSQQALEGVDFATRLGCSASMGAPVFREVCAELGIPPERIGPDKRQQIDQTMQQRFSEAASSGLSPVPLDTARSWLRELIPTS